MPRWKAKIRGYLSMHYARVIISQKSPDGSSRWHKSVPYSVACPCLQPLGTAHQKQRPWAVLLRLPILQFTPFHSRIVGVCPACESVSLGGHRTRSPFSSAVRVLGPIGRTFFSLKPSDFDVARSSHFVPTLVQNSVLFLSPPSFFPCLFVPAFHVSLCPPIVATLVCLPVTLARCPHGNVLISQDHLLASRRRHLLHVYHRKLRAVRSLTSEEAATWMKKRGCRHCAIMELMQLTYRLPLLNMEDEQISRPWIYEQSGLGIRRKLRLWNLEILWLDFFFFLLETMTIQ